MSSIFRLAINFSSFD